MGYHIPNGDSLAHGFPAAEIEGELIVIREGLVDGDPSGGNLQDFWRSRFDLFCQVNMWFTLSLLSELPSAGKIYFVPTAHLDRTSPQFWNGFGPANAAELRHRFASRRQ